jgi:hypothetical protein
MTAGFPNPLITFSDSKLEINGVHPVFSTLSARIVFTEKGNSFRIEGGNSHRQIQDVPYMFGAVEWI